MLLIRRQLSPGYGGSQCDAARGSWRSGVTLSIDVGRVGAGTSRDVTETPGEAGPSPATVTVQLTVALAYQGLRRTVGSLYLRAEASARADRLPGSVKNVPSGEVQ